MQAEKSVSLNDIASACMDEFAKKFGSQLQPQQQQQAIPTPSSSNQIDYTTMNNLCGDVIKMGRQMEIFNSRLSQLSTPQQPDNVSFYSAPRSVVSGTTSIGPSASQVQNLNPNGRDMTCNITRLDEKIVPKGFKSVDDLPIVDAKVNNQQVRVLVDTGANRTVISSDLVEELGLQIQPLKRRMGAEGIGGRIEFIGAVDLQLELGKTTRNVSAFVAKHNDVFRNVSFLALISFRTLAEFPAITFNSAERWISIDGFRLPAGDKSPKSFHYLRVDDHLTLKPNQHTKVQVYLDTKTTQKCDGLHVEKISNIETKHGFSVEPCVINADGNAFVFIANNSQKEINLFPGMCVAKANRVQQLSNSDTVQYLDAETPSSIGYLKGFPLTG